MNAGIRAGQDRLARHGIVTGETGETVHTAIEIVAAEAERTHPRAEELFIESMTVAEAIRQQRGEEPLRATDVRLIREFFVWMFNNFWHDD